MPKTSTKFVPIGTEIVEEKINNSGKSLREIEQEAIEKRQKSGTKQALGNTSERHNYGKLLVDTVSISPGKTTDEDGDSNNDTVSISKEIEKYKLHIPKPKKIEPLVDIKEPEIKLPDFDIANLEEDILKAFAEVESQVQADIESKRIALYPPKPVNDLKALSSSLDQACDSISAEINFDIRDERKVKYSKELTQASSKLDKLEQSIDYETYNNELRLLEFEDSQLRVNRYRKRRLDGLEEIGGIEEKDHNTSEKNTIIDLRKNTDFSDEDQRASLRSKEDVVIRRDFVQDYEGSDLEGIDDARDKLEKEITSAQNAKKNKLFSSKSDEDKIAEAKEKLRKKQLKRKAKQQKKRSTTDNPDIDLVGNQFDVEELREERMDRLLEIKRISAEKKEMQKQKEKQRSKATKEFYKYKKVNKKSHIVGFKQNW